MEVVEKTEGAEKTSTVLKMGNTTAWFCCFRQQLSLFTWAKDPYF